VVDSTVDGAVAAARYRYEHRQHRGRAGRGGLVLRVRMAPVPNAARATPGAQSGSARVDPADPDRPRQPGLHHSPEPARGAGHAGHRQWVQPPRLPLVPGSRRRRAAPGRGGQPALVELSPGDAGLVAVAGFRVARLGALGLELLHHWWPVAPPGPARGRRRLSAALAASSLLTGC